MSTLEQISNALTEIAESYWSAAQQPILLSNVPPLLNAKIRDYKETLGVRSLKQFIKESEAQSNYRLIQHPTQRAKIALLPKSASFEFASSTTSDSAAHKDERSSEKALIDFLRALKRLPLSDLTEVKLPVAVLVKLLK